MEWELQQYEKWCRNYKKKARKKWTIKFQGEKHTRRKYKQAGWSRGSNQQAERQGRKKKHSETTRKGKETQKERICGKELQQHET